MAEIDLRELSDRLIGNMEKVIIGKRQALEFIVIGLLAQGHILVEDVPGVGKTMLARSLARSLGCKFSRLQFTPDMLPTDVTGVSIFNQVTREFEFKPGPVLSQIVLVDEINRATPKTQSALLEAMEERQVTVDGNTYTLPEPFLVIATQNPIEYEGTFPLPEAQLDRFMLKIELGYPSLNDEMLVLDLQQIRHPIRDLEPVIKLDELLAAQEYVKKVFVSPAVKRYIVELVRATRNHSDVYLGSSPRGSLALYKTGQVKAAMEGRNYVTPDDIQYLTQYALPHRIMLNPAARLRNLSANQVLEEVVINTKVVGKDFGPEEKV